MKIYTTSLTRPLSQLMIGLGLENLPDIRIVPESEAGVLASGMLTQGLNHGPRESLTTAIETDMSLIGDYLDDECNEMRVGAIDEHAAAFAGAIENASSVLKNDVGGLVQSITEDVEVELQRILKRDKNEDILSGESEVSESDYDFLVWKGLRSPVIQEAVVEETNRIVGLRTGLLRSNQDIILGKLVRPDHTTIELPAEPKTEFLDALKKKFMGAENGIPEIRIERFFKSVFSSQAYRRMALETSKPFDDNRNLAQTAMTTVDMVADWKRMIAATEQMLSKYMDSATENKIKKNLTNLSESMILVSYCLLLVKEFTFKGKLVLTDTIINNEAYEMLVQQGLSIERVHNYLKVLYRNRPVPLAGIPTELVAASEVEERLNETIASIRLNEKRIMSESLIAAYEAIIRKTATQFIDEDQYECGSQKTIAEDFVTRALKGRRFFKGSIPIMQEFLYNCILRSFYKDTLVEKMYSFLDDTTGELCSKQDTMITDDEVLRAEMKSIINPLAEFLVEQVVLKENKKK